MQGVIYGGEKMCRAEILSNDPNPHTIVCSTYYPYFREDTSTNASYPYYWQKTYYPDYIVIHLDEPKMDIKARGKVTLRFADGREIVIKAGDDNEES
jgi:hypothetical protein